MAKIKDFFVRNWAWLKWVTILPIALIGLSRILKWYVNLLVKKDDTDESLHKADVKLRTDTIEANRKTDILLDNLKKEKEDKLGNLMKNDPSPADVMNEEIGVTGKGKETK
jgi:hypothetical protein